MVCFNCKTLEHSVSLCKTDRGPAKPRTPMNVSVCLCNVFAPECDRQGMKLTLILIFVTLTLTRLRVYRILLSCHSLADMQILVHSRRYNPRRTSGPNSKTAHRQGSIPGKEQEPHTAEAKERW